MKKLGIIFLVGIIIWYSAPKLSNTQESQETFNETKISNENTNLELSSNKASIDNFSNIKIGDSKEYLLSQIGEPARIDVSEYNFEWYVYNQYSTKFAMIGVENDTVVAIYSNSMDSADMENIKLNDERDYVRGNYEPLEYKKKGNTRYIINSQDQYDILKVNDKYITVFYDIYENNKVCSYQIISSKAEASLDGMYPQDSEELRKSFELQVIDLTNSVREQRGLNRLQYSDQATESSRFHSNDMMEKNYFDHLDKDNKTPFDRMKETGIVYTGAGENIAAGQVSAIYAHEAWMDSQGHRKNILGDYKYIGVGVVFGGHYTIYYTQNFYI
ncbi:MAG: CAP-associated domain-containing protein [Peptostreptococcaceae bacterium]